MNIPAHNRKGPPLRAIAQWGIHLLRGTEGQFFSQDPEGYEWIVAVLARRRQVGAIIGEYIGEHFSGKPGPQSALDVACGTGIITQAVEPHIAAEGSIIGMDISPEALAYAQRTKSARIQWRQGSYEKLEGIADGSVDVYSMVAAHRFIHDLRAFYGEMARVLSDEGIAILCCPFPDMTPLDRYRVRKLAPELGLEIVRRRRKIRSLLTDLAVPLLLIKKR